jgi:membrane fusion protein (multidrug efflux system)
MKVSSTKSFILLLISISLPACNQSHEKPRAPIRQVTVTTVELKPVTLSEQYVCQINAYHHINVRAPESGYLAEIPVRAGQTVQQYDVLFKLQGAIGKSIPDPSSANVITITAPFEGRVDRPAFQQGSLVEKGQTLTTLSDNSQICAYFNVPEARYLEYSSFKQKEDLTVELQLVNGSKFAHQGQLNSIGANFNPETGTISFRADFPNPESYLRHGQTGILIISRVQNDAVVIPQQATFDFFGKRYVFVVDQDHVARQREVTIQGEADDLFVIKSGIDVNDTVVIDGIRNLTHGDKVDFDDHNSKNVVAHLKNHVK